MNTPVVFIIFNRPDKAERVFAEIAKARPSKLLVVADGPRVGYPEDVEKCSAARRVTENVDWECDVLRRYSDLNLGCGKGPAEGLDWAFEIVEEAIILEDDCLPDPTFFRFCEELLEKYRHDERVMKVSGRNDLWDGTQSSYSYFFERIGPCWGWATWRRAWEKYDFEISYWPELRDSGWLKNLRFHPAAAEYWHQIFEKTHSNPAGVNHWDYQWLFCIWVNNGFSVIPSVNLIHNIGFGEGATHTKDSASPRGNLATGSMDFPLRHPPAVELDGRAETDFIEKVLWPRILARSKIRRWALHQKIDRILEQLLKTYG